MKYKIYKLVDNNGVVQYVGQTIRTLEERKRGNYGINRELFKTFNIELIEETDDISRERYWIEHYRSINPNLFNIKNGSGLDIIKYLKEYRDKNIDIINRNRKEYLEANKEIMKQKSREYYIKNKESISQKKKEYRENNKEYFKEYDKKRRK